MQRAGEWLSEDQRGQDIQKHLSFFGAKARAFANLVTYSNSLGHLWVASTKAAGLEGPRLDGPGLS